MSHPQSIAAQAGISNDIPSMIVFTLGLIFQPLAAAHGDITSTSYATTTSASIPSLPSLASSSSRTGQEGGAFGHSEGQVLDSEGTIQIAATIHEDDLPALLESFVPAPEETALPIAGRREALVDRIEVWARVRIPSSLVNLCGTDHEQWIQWCPDYVEDVLRYDDLQILGGGWANQRQLALDWCLGGWYSSAFAREQLRRLLRDPWPAHDEKRLRRLRLLAIAHLMKLGWRADPSRMSAASRDDFLMQNTAASPTTPPEALPHLLLFPHLLTDQASGELTLYGVPPDEDYDSVDHEGVPNPSPLDLEVMISGTVGGDNLTDHDSDVVMQDEEHGPHHGPVLSDEEFDRQLQRILRRSRDGPDEAAARDPTACSSRSAPRPASPTALLARSTSSSSSGSSGTGDDFDATMAAHGFGELFFWPTVHLLTWHIHLWPILRLKATLRIVNAKFHECRMTHLGIAFHLGIMKMLLRYLAKKMKRWLLHFLLGSLSMALHTMLLIVDEFTMAPSDGAPYDSVDFLAPAYDALDYFDTSLRGAGGPGRQAPPTVSVLAPGAAAPAQLLGGAAASRDRSLEETIRADDFPQRHGAGPQPASLGRSAGGAAWRPAAASAASPSGRSVAGTFRVARMFSTDAEESWQPPADPEQPPRPSLELARRRASDRQRLRAGGPPRGPDSLPALGHGPGPSQDESQVRELVLRLHSRMDDVESLLQESLHDRLDRALESALNGPIERMTKTLADSFGAIVDAIQADKSDAGSPGAEWPTDDQMGAAVERGIVEAANDLEVPLPPLRRVASCGDGDLAAYGSSWQDSPSRASARGGAWQVVESISSAFNLKSRLGGLRDHGAEQGASARPSLRKDDRDGHLEPPSEAGRAGTAEHLAPPPRDHPRSPPEDPEGTGLSVAAGTDDALQQTSVAFQPHLPESPSDGSALARAASETSGHTGNGEASERMRRHYTHYTEITKVWQQTSTAKARAHRKDHGAQKDLQQRLSTSATQMLLGLCSFLLVANVVWVGVRAQTLSSFELDRHALTVNWSWQGRPQSEASLPYKPDLEHPAWLVGVDTTLTIAFIGEIALRIYIYRGHFLCAAKGWGWNLLDAFLLSAAMVEVLLTAAGAENFPTMTFLRILRLPRIFLDLGRLEWFHKLQLVTRCMIKSISYFGVALFVILGTIYLFSVCMVQGIIDYLAGTDVGSIDTDILESMAVNYGSVTLTSISLYQGISGGVDWAQLMEPLLLLPGRYTVLLMAYVFMMMFGVLNIIASLFVECVYHVAKDDYQERVRSEILEQKRWSDHLRNLFYEADQDESDSLSWEEFSQILRVPMMKAFFKSLELNLKDSKQIFDYLDVKGNGELTLEDFIQGCTVLRGEAKSVDIAVLRSEWQRSTKQLQGQMKTNLRQLQRGLGTVVGPPQRMTTAAAPSPSALSGRRASRALLGAALEPHVSHRPRRGSLSILLASPRESVM
ncbi:unnamed protein product [Prorocentrum cordatum]|uniref:EF-hand domain-containing protein n=1 Tax=Prorocentrum cordatum TaxID=2364126 RepID=A0ABN9SAJ8_9DINO|nr:unnamed protein product [Polarella glacialis]